MNPLILTLIFFIAIAYTWDPIGPGTDYHYQRYADFNDIFIVRVERSNPLPVIDTMVAFDKVRGARERTTSLYNRYDDSLTAWPNGELDGTRYKAIAAVNGYYFDMRTGGWISGGISNGWYVHRFDNLQAKPGFGSGYAIKNDKSVFIGECVTHPFEKNHLVFTKQEAKISIDGVNVPRGNDATILYTPQYDLTTPEEVAGVEIIVELSKAAGISSESKKVSGVVKQVIKSKGGAVIPFDCVVISASGKKAEQLASAAVGDAVEIYQDMNIFDEGTCKTPIVGDSWMNTFSALGGAYHYLKGGNRHIYKDTTRHPRTAMAYNDKYLFFFVVDGRTSKSRGMTIDELSDFAQTFLNATDGIALDGGGSSTMVVNGRIKNFPSDGSERTVTNAVLIAVPVPKEVSNKFHSGDVVVTAEGAELYSGPGTNHHKITTLHAKAEGNIVAHKLSGVKAKGTHWWKVKIGQSVGWVAEGKLIHK